MDKIILEYVWIGGSGELRSKTKVLPVKRADLPPIFNEIPVWNYDGSSTEQATTESSEILIKPRCVFCDPFRRERSHGKSSYIVLCDTYLPNGVPHHTNTRAKASQIFEKADRLQLKPLYGLEQEFFMIDSDTMRPLGFPKDLSTYPEKQGKYYCGVGTGKVFGREIMEEVFDNCLYAGIALTGMNFEVAPGQCELQVSEYGITAGDHLVICRYILERTIEKYGLKLDLTPKPVKGDWNGSGCHVNFSTEPMRQPGGYEIIKEAIEKLGKKHKEHLALYGMGNNERLTGKHETSSMEKFTYGVADRSASVRIPEDTANKGCGYFEDRRPAGCMDPYLVIAKILETTSL